MRDRTSGISHGADRPVLNCSLTMFQYSLQCIDHFGEYSIMSNSTAHPSLMEGAHHRPQVRALLERWRGDMLNATKARHITPDKQNNWTVTDQLALTLIFAVGSPLSRAKPLPPQRGAASQNKQKRAYTMTCAGSYLDRMCTALADKTSLLQNQKVQDVPSHLPYVCVQESNDLITEASGR